MYPGILEADDVISWLSKEIKGRTVIVSVDQDMLQLVDQKTVVYSPIKDVLITIENFEEVTGVSNDQFLRYKSLMGDKSDNLPGLPKCGPKTAKKLVEKYPDDKLLEEELGTEKLKPYFLNKRLIDLSQGIIEHPDDKRIYNEQYEKLKGMQHDFSRFTQMCEDLNMNAILNKLDDWKTTFTGSELVSTLESIVNKLNLDK
jgi:5'-3' exonuclease